MTSFIIVAKDKDKRLAYARDYCTKLSIDPFDITLIERDIETKGAHSIGIEDVKNMQKKIFLKPFKSKTKAIVIEESHLLTNEAQNALLKVLEEPPMHTILLLTADTKEAFLPTIISRCKVIELEEEKVAISEKELAEYRDFINNLPKLSIGERLKKAETLAKDKEKGVEWISKLILVARENALNNVILGRSETTTPESHNGTDSGRASLARMTKYLRAFQSLHTTLKTTNVNPRFAIENTLLSLL